MKTKLLLWLALVLSGGLIACSGAETRTVAVSRHDIKLTTLVSFDGTNGCEPRGRLVLGRDGDLYGTTYNGGASMGQGPRSLGYGTVFRVTTNGDLTTLVSFNGTNGANPVGSLVEEDDGDFYGVTYAGGTNLNNGTIFCVSSHGELEMLHSFGGSDGWDNGLRKAQHLQHWQGCGCPLAGLTRSRDGNFYGSTSYGGFDYGTIFRMAPGGQVTYVFAFNQTNGAMPATKLATDAEGNFYGTTDEGSTNGLGRGGYGTVFKITSEGKLLWYVCFDGANGLTPNTGLVNGPGGCFYGTTAGGCYTLVYRRDGLPAKSAFSCGTIFRLTTNGILTTLASFDHSGGVCPIGKLVTTKDGDAYGAVECCRNGKIGCGEWLLGNGGIFRMTPNGRVGIVAEFTGGNTKPAGGLTVGPDGNLYGMTANGGKHNLGSIFKITLHGVADKNHL